MTREEVKKEFWKEGGIFEELFEHCFNKVLKLPYKGRVIDIFIDKIYDDFENRICKNCKFLIKTSKGLLCSNPVNYNYIITDEKFGCNRFEKKGE